MVLLTLAGGASLIGVWAYKRVEHQKQRHRIKNSSPTAGRAWWQTVQAALQSGRQRLTHRSLHSPTTSKVDEPLLAFVPYVDDPNATIRYGWQTSMLALGVTSIGRLATPSLQVAGLPLLIYMGIPSAQQAYYQLREEGRPGRALAETVVLTVCLAGGHYWVGALGFWLYYGSRSLQADPPSKNAQCQTPAEMTTLQPGDQVFFHSGELISVDGLITEGVAWLRSQVLSSATYGLRKGIGDRVMATDIVLVGQIGVRVLPTS